VKMSCPTCEAVRDVIEVRRMMCCGCGDEFSTPEQFQAMLDAERACRKERYDPDSHKEEKR